MASTVIRSAQTTSMFPYNVDKYPSVFFFICIIILFRWHQPLVSFSSTSPYHYIFIVYTCTRNFHSFFFAPPRLLSIFILLILLPIPSLSTFLHTYPNRLNLLSLILPAMFVTSKLSIIYFSVIPSHHISTSVFLFLQLPFLFLLSYLVSNTQIHTSFLASLQSY